MEFDINQVTYLLRCNSKEIQQQYCSTCINCLPYSNPICENKCLSHSEYVLNKELLEEVDLKIDNILL